MSIDVTMLGWGYPPNIEGGLDVHVARLFEHFRESSVDVTLVLPDEYAPNHDSVVGVPTGKGDISTRMSALSGRFVEEAAGSDIVHTHDWFGCEPGVRAAQVTDAAWISTFHSLSRDRNRTPIEQQRRMEQYVIAQSDAVIAVSERLGSAIEARDLHVVHNGFCSKPESGYDVRSELGFEGLPIVFFVGRHVGQKGLPHLVLAFEKVLAERDALLVLGGTGPLRKQLQRFAEQLGIEDRVVFPGYIPSNRLGDYYAAAEAFVSPSRSEPFGLTITEALMQGTTVVASECGVDEILPDDALISVENHSDSIADGIRRALDREHSPSFEPRGWDECGEETRAVYRQVIRRRG